MGFFAAVNTANAEPEPSLRLACSTFYITTLAYIKICT